MVQEYLDQFRMYTATQEQGGAGMPEIVEADIRQTRPLIRELAEKNQQAYNEIRRLAADPEPAPLTYPDAVEEKKAEKAWSKHLYVDERSLFSEKFNKWETKVIEAELAREDLVGWLRNPPRKSWSLCIPYTLVGERRLLYPYFLFVRSEGGRLIVDLLDPHRIRPRR